MLATTTFHPPAGIAHASSGFTLMECDVATRVVAVHSGLTKVRFGVVGWGWGWGCSRAHLRPSNMPV